ncbi:hypothetical protein LPJ81_000391 [Coemansia sp. IMI 209127]|nr:hypothetical protein LPJ81_000391 [Coemansia sp. IMI 209127]
MSYIPKPTHQKKGTSTATARAKPQTPPETSRSTLSNRTRLLRNQGHQHKQYTPYDSKEAHSGLASEASLLGQNLRIHHCKDSGIVRLFPFEAASHSRTNTESRRLDDSAIGIQSSSCTHPVLGLDPRPASVKQCVPAKPDCVSTRYRSASDNSGTAVHDAAAIAATGIRAPEPQNIQKPPLFGAPAKPVRRKTMSPTPETEGCSSQIKSAHAKQVNEFRPWVAKESEFMARACLRYWTSGQTVDYSIISRELDRPQKEIRTMLQLMLLEHQLFAHKLYWPLENEAFVKRWAAAEFPKCPTLNHTKSSSGRRLAGFTSVDSCIAVIRCSRQPVASVSTISVDLSATEPNNTPQPVPVNACKPPKFELVSASLTALEQKQIYKAGKDKTAHLAPNSTSQSVDDAIEAIAALTLSKKPQVLAGPDSMKALSLSSRKDVNVLSRNSRVRRAHGRSRNSTNTTRTSGAKVSYMARNIAQTSTSPAPHKLDTKELPEPKRVLFGAKNTTTTTETRSSSSKPSLLNGSAKPGAEPEALAPTPHRSKDAELSPEQSTDTCDFNRLDGDIDMRFFDITAVSRKSVRSFVDKYIETFFDSFFYRIAHPHIEDNDRLCLRLEKCLDGNVSLADNDLLVRLQKEMLTFDALDIAEECGSRDIKGSSDNMAKLGIRLSKASLHFHMCFSRAIEECKIYKGDANWPSANVYATSVFNRAIEDAHYLVFEGLRGMSEYSYGSGLSAIQYLRTEDMIVRANKFKRAYYMGIVSSAVVSRYVQNDGQQTFLKRIEISGIHPVPTALDFDDNLSEEELDSELETPWSDVSIRGELHNLIMEVMPYATNKSTMLAMQQSIEIYNKVIVDHTGKLQHEPPGVFDSSTKAVGLQAETRATLELLEGVVSVDTACKVAEHLAELWFDQVKMGMLRALIVDHAFMPVSLNDIRRWIIEDRSPGGRDIDFAINTRLYTYLKFSRVRMNETKWLYASGAATLRMIELTTQVKQPAIATPSMKNLICLRLDLCYPQLRHWTRKGTFLVRVLLALSSMPIQDMTLKRQVFAESSKNGTSFRTEKTAYLGSGTEARINGLESEITKLRQEMRDIAEMRRDVNLILGMLYDRYSGGPVAAPPFEKRALSEF